MFSKISKTTIKTLRHYDEVGLLAPAHVDEENGYRYYTTDQLFKLHEIIGLRQIGFSIPEISAIMAGQHMEEILTRRKVEMQSELNEITDQLFRLNHYISKQKEGYSMNYQAVVKDIPECIVFSKRQVIPNYGALMEVVPAIGEAIIKANPTLKCAEPEYCFNIYHDGEYKESNIDVEVCEAVTDFGVETEGIVFKIAPAITAVSVMHKGAYHDLGNAYAYVFNWIEQNGYVVTGNSRESYIDGIWNKESEADWLTEVQVPVAKK